MASRTNMQCLLKIDTHSGGWEKCLSKMLKKIRGAKYSLDVQEGTLLVAGKVDPTKVLNKLKKAGKAAEILWVSTGAAEIVYFEDPNLYSNHYSPYNSDYSYTSNGYGPGYYPSSSYGHHHQLPNPHHYLYGGHGYAGFY
uniref:uncharacterized protein LOC105350543 n=1 Tax=Fragaria vesca subsp. vesca TaxID=101020 RepID=UPI0005C85BE3|nr:PREDICTED: uncharacterized protein LOC105350543 [Fragaria vesca subsp. vesca]